MVQNVTVSLPALVIALSVLILAILFWLFSRNAMRITSTLDNKQSLEQHVTALSDVLGEVLRQHPVPDTTRGFPVTAATAPQLTTLLNALETVKLLNNDRVYLFILDSKGNMVMNGGAPHIATKGGMARPGNNVLEYVDGDGNRAVQAILSKASSGGGYVEYKWPCPKTQQSMKKLSYVKSIPHSPWVLGAGLYV